MNTELYMLRLMSRNLPRVRGAGRIGDWCRRIYQRKPRPPVVTDVLGFQMRLNPMEFVDGHLLFVPQIYDHRELKALQQTIQEGDTFLDVGSYNGFYSLFAAGLVKNSGRVLAIEADPNTARLCGENLRLNGLSNVEVVNCGVSDRHEKLRLGIVPTNRGASSFLADDQARGVEVPCYPLAQILRERKITTVKAAKFDIEGFGSRVLRQFLNDWPAEHLPRTLIVEKEPGQTEWLQQRGYRLAGGSALNDILVR